MASSKEERSTFVSDLMVSDHLEATGVVNNSCEYIVLNSVERIDHIVAICRLAFSE